MPHELVLEILAHLPVQSLLRLSRVCRAWRATISSDASFHRVHQRLQKRCKLVSPRWRFGPEPYLCCPKTVGLYRREPGQEDDYTPLVVYGSMPQYCPRLTRTDPNGSGEPNAQPYFYRSAVSGGSYTTGMEVFTVGVDWYWREMAAQLQYPIVPQWTAAFFKGFLLWTISDEIFKDVAPCFLRFGLEDEEFVVTPLPPYHPTSHKTMTSFVELRGDLVVACVGATVEMWMCDDINNPRWDLRYKVNAMARGLASLSPIAVFDGDIVFKDEVLCCLISYDLQTKAANDVVRMKELRYHNPNTGTVVL
nr:uncharacterized protein LOC109780499 [Aegilops tauschii subsp. strangulata]